ncbi:fumarate/nitrate reduction transcriptional regulator Fnr [Pseudomonas sp. GD04087]|uniref:fumarate/nitrate reduction transcriptional regulator Fnr n=1 Tax=unclassified Pseudomonas TaxID=196821 RepID=UPI00244B611C|nr:MULTISPECIES: fumarate/nitrate reduction transcriptional regulator Fnr [unclassified Pseudomonas]MDH0293485.1 fumarate/nitrate reduction transcriptional regulator Fnr [Pseudomonas sp. GD04087]MDH1053051.1 fumarate/nitrate reduction transcriptional regulator Fnr [Pseudomonas sp. GD03903]
MGGPHRKIMRHQIHCGSCVLAGHCLPSSLSVSEVDILDEMVRRSRPLGRGEFLFRQGDEFRSIFVIRTGMIKKYCITDAGVEKVTGFQSPGEILGWAGVDCGEYPMSAQVLEPTSVCEIPFERLDELAEAIPQLRRQLMRLMSREIWEDQQMMLLFSKRSSEERIATFLLSLSARFRARGYYAHTFRLSMSRGEIGNYLGVAMETVSRSFTKLQQLGLIRVSGKEVQIIDYLSFCELAGSDEG